MLWVGKRARDETKLSKAKPWNSNFTEWEFPPYSWLPHSCNLSHPVIIQEEQTKSSGDCHQVGYKRAHLTTKLQCMWWWPWFHTGLLTKTAWREERNRIRWDPRSTSTSTLGLCQCLLLAPITRKTYIIRWQRVKCREFFSVLCWVEQNRMTLVTISSYDGLIIQ